MKKKKNLSLFIITVTVLYLFKSPDNISSLLIFLFIIYALEDFFEIKIVKNFLKIVKSFMSRESFNNSKIYKNNTKTDK